MKTTLRHIAVAILGMLALLLPAPATAAEPAQPSGTDSTFIQVGPTQVEASLNIHTEQELNDFLLSSTPKDVWEDVETGNVTKVTLHKEEAAPYTDYQSYCDTFTLCLMTPGGADVAGFKNSGIRAGRWGGVGQWRTLAISGGQIRYSQNGRYITTAKKAPGHGVDCPEPSTWYKFESGTDIPKSTSPGHRCPAISAGHRFIHSTTLM